MPALPPGDGAMKDVALMLKQSWYSPSAKTVVIAAHPHCETRTLIAKLAN